MKTYCVTVERLTIDNRVFSTETFSIMVRGTDEATAVVHNHMVLHYELLFRISKVVEERT